MNRFPYFGGLSSSLLQGDVAARVRPGRLFCFGVVVMDIPMWLMADHAKRTQTLAARVEPELEQFAKDKAHLNNLTVSDYVRLLILADRQADKRAWDELRPSLEHAPDLQD